MQKRRIRTGLFFLMMVLLFVLTGCSSNSSDSQGKAKILMSVSDASDTFRASLAKAAKEAADEKGITLEVMDAKSSVDTQVAQMKQAKEEGYDGVNPFVISLVNEVLKAKGREEIPTGIKGTKQREP